MLLKKNFISLIAISIILPSFSAYASDQGGGSAGGEPDSGEVFNPTLPQPKPQPKPQPLPPPPAPICETEPCVPPPPPAPVQLTPGQVAVMVCFDESLKNPDTGDYYCVVTDGNRIGRIIEVDNPSNPQDVCVQWEGWGCEIANVHALYPEVSPSFHNLNRKYPQLDPINVPSLYDMIDSDPRDGRYKLITEVSYRAPDNILRAGQIFRVFYDGTAEYTSEMHRPEYYRFTDYAVANVRDMGRRVLTHGQWREGDEAIFNDGGLGNTQIVKLYSNNTALIDRHFGSNSNTENVKVLDGAYKPGQYNGGGNGGGYNGGYHQTYGGSHGFGPHNNHGGGGHYPHPYQGRCDYGPNYGPAPVLAPSNSYRRQPQVGQQSASQQHFGAISLDNDPSEGGKYEVIYVRPNEHVVAKGGITIGGRVIRKPQKVIRRSY